ncbi:hypothetical protein HH214_04150 [Mucilaginibacter robiniae]|uniref:Uncharacterized protein n=1 Tax=Mucilaginibacter robiniae TaxID=2728022 RepID=A0A7L5DVJ7_9SPHI|nr:hypothetical protein [Mucilaginibacter robiniae]QJD95125.1 hypothetical protein HH214_04150 [Mucilaginibacter robiniae]
MERAVKHYKFINSGTENAIFYYTLEEDINPATVKEKLESIKAQVAIKYGLFLETVYYQEILDEE